ncbi:unnamed protein product [Lymnaea stagnalis]|uniref:CHAT domain-containing protein n=1 Tax=Lymnaea stagnalis TaxID=6523 RepID=A0AAV2HSR3_LYMST
MQTILSAMSNKLGCLQYAEAHRKRSLITLPNFQLTCRADNHSLDSSREIWGTDHMKRIVSSQNATVLYYSLLENQLLIWVLAPGEGVVRFYSTKASTAHTFTQQITKLLSDMRADWDTSELLTTSEARALPLRDAEIQNLRLNNMKHYESKTKYKSTESEHMNSTITQTPNDSARGTNALSEESLNSKKTGNDSSCDFTKILNESSSTGAETTTCLNDQEKITRKPALRQLYEILISPVSDILENLKQGSHLVIVPDKILNFCPFGALLDHQDKNLYERFSISYISCLLLLDRVIQNELSSLSAEDALNVKRKQACGGGVAQYLSELPGNFHLHNANPDPDSADDTSDSTKKYQRQSINLKEVSNPRLVSYRTHVSPVQKSINMDKTRLELPGRSQTSESRSRSHSPRAEKSGVMAPNLLSDHPSVVEKMLATHTYSTLCAETWTHTDVTSSSQVIPQFQQISDPRTALVFGCPWITQGIKIHDKEWRPKPDLIKAQSELMLVSQCLGTDPILGEQATRQELLTSLETAEVIHIGTWACMRDGLLLVTPEPLTDKEDDTSHLVTISDILNVRLRAKLVVLSTCGLSPARAEQECPMKLAGSFLSAGAECVLVCKWPVPDEVLCKFLVHFYHTLQNSEFVSKALSSGIKAIREDNRWSHVCHWSGFMLVGKDTKMSLSDVRHAQLDQLIDKCEAETEESSAVPILNPKSSIPNFGSKEENLAMLQLHLKNLLRNHYKNPQVIPELFDLLDTALKRLHTMDSTKLPCQLTELLAKNHQAMNLLKWLGFHFQAKEAKLTNPYIIFPHWNTDHLLIPTYDALKAASELTCSPACVTAICETLPLSQDKISILIDLLTITKHASDIQLRVTDFSVHPLWHNTRTKALLTTTGFHQVGLLLSFNMVGMHKQLLVAMLQLLLSFSCYKSPVLLFKLDVNLLGHSNKARDPVIECPKLPSLMPLLLPRNQLRMSSPWLSVIEQKDEMQEKIKLARSATNLSEEYLGHLEKAKTWHHTTVTAQAKETLDKYGRPSSSPKSKVKVKPGSTPSEPRVPVDYEKLLTPRVVRQRRNYAHFVLEERVENIDKRKKDNLVKLYLPYIHS